VSKTNASTDPAVIVSVTFLRENLAPDTDGHLSGTPTTLASGVQGDLQPASGNMRLSMSGLDPFSIYTFFPLARVSAGVVQGDWMELGGIRYRVAMIFDWGPTYPQEFGLERMTN
jgi:hypothetical protein